MEGGREIKNNHGRLRWSAWKPRRDTPCGCSMGAGGGGRKLQLGSGSGKLSWQGLPGGHLHNSEVAALRPTSELADDLLQKQVVLVAVKKCFTVLGPHS